MKALLALVASLLVALPAAAADNAVASFSWRLDFGAQAFEAGYGLSLGYRGDEHFVPLSRLVDLKVDHGSALAAIAGLPLATRGYQADQSADAAYDAGIQEKTPEQPWYAHQWVWWTLGGVAASAALGGISVNSETHNTCTNCNEQPSGRTTVVTTDGQDAYVGCVQGTCAVCPDGSIQSTCLVAAGASARGFESPDLETTDETGGMGALVMQ